jgi:uncharacterized DUF497 family protein
MITWDPNKAASNLVKHGVDFVDAVSVLEDEMALTIEDHDEFEPRFVTIGTDSVGQILVVVYAYEEGDEEDAYEEEVIRIISARKANKRERKQYQG